MIVCQNYLIVNFNAVAAVRSTVLLSISFYICICTCSVFHSFNWFYVAYLNEQNLRFWFAWFDLYRFSSPIARKRHMVGLSYRVGCWE